MFTNSILGRDEKKVRQEIRKKLLQYYFNLVFEVLLVSLGLTFFLPGHFIWPVWIIIVASAWVVLGWIKNVIHG